MNPVSILIVDDDPMLGNCLRDWLEDEGFWVSVASSADTALKILSTMKFNVCISDLTLVGMSGDDLIRRAIPVYPQTRFMILTGMHSYSLDSHLRSLGMRDDFVLYKPIFSMKILSDAILSALTEVAHEC